ncbi:filamentous hemagglutinin [Formivibrio citricus]|uniref:Filamentous hemagglutinin n=1 Tax=Formivibrio citricus TaxID=83765 RepID=A0A1I5E5B5_9NEIS|nr:hypothetical protein [Formivibrio citricus]SFO06735.1 filamentous hemagglutinin [Formivibrio citricus]
MADFPGISQQRLGDGFYEQRLIREQVAQLTGRRFLDGYASDEAQYRALMDNGITAAQTRLNVSAGRDLTVASTTARNQNAQGSITHLDRIN